TLDDGGNAGQDLLLLTHARQRPLAGYRLDASHTGGDAAFLHNAEQPDITGTRDVGTPTQLNRKYFRFSFYLTVSHGYNTNDIAIFFAKERHGSQSLRLGDGHGAMFDGRIGQDLLVHQIFHG